MVHRSEGLRDDSEFPVRRYDSWDESYDGLSVFVNKNYVGIGTGSYVSFSLWRGPARLVGSDLSKPLI